LNALARRFPVGTHSLAAVSPRPAIISAKAIKPETDAL
jgi:hypothetical protein